MALEKRPMLKKTNYRYVDIIEFLDHKILTKFSDIHIDFSDAKIR